MQRKSSTRALVALIFSCLYTLAGAGCATNQKSETEAKRLHAMQLKLKKQHALLQDLKERNMVLEQRSRNRAAAAVEVTGDEAVVDSDFVPTEAMSEPPAALPLSFAPSVAASPKILPSKLPSKVSVVPARALAAVPPTPIAISQEQTGEHYLYSKILSTYRSKNSSELERTLALLVKSYPESVFTDNAIYLDGMLAFEGGDVSKATRTFDQLLRDYPRSNKAVSALFAKAVIQKRAGHMGSAKRELIQVRDLYPGSPEAARVSVELKLLESAKGAAQ